MRNILTPSLSLILALLLRSCSATDYCAKKCFNGHGYDEHIGCNNKGAWASYCPSDKQLLPLTSVQKAAIVDRHNQHRNFIAGGGASHLSGACRMATMRWNDELAYLASLNVRSCQMKHDKCRKTDDFELAGQSLYTMCRSGSFNDTLELITAVDACYGEVKHVKQSHIDAFKEIAGPPFIARFAALVADRNIAVGCAVSTFSWGNMFKTFLMACNYATSILPEHKVYNSCAKPASKCSTGVNPSYKFLCNSNEEINPNNVN
ncbi:antigen 5 like allergen Cul n 1-like [Drosophila busckii]|uniref:antigen 5 like allergen Cul n 1-like n=1 Tax=Drosophila busckii TaxID=30019 RepID=UPI00083ECE46|nr:antigen 5 like allergen Cul n 1-like [Drosophila busckii]